MLPRLLTAHFSRRLCLLMLLATVPGMLGGIWILSDLSADQMRASATEKLASSARVVATRVDDWVDDISRDLKLLARHPDLVGMDPPRQRQLLRYWRQIDDEISYAHTIGPDGIDVARMDDKPPLYYGDRSYFRRAMAGAPLVCEMIPRSRSTGCAALNQAAPIINPQGKIVGVVVLGSDLDTLAKLIGAERYGRTGYSCLVDATGRTLAHPGLAAGDGPEDLRGLPPVQGVLRDRSRGAYRFHDEHGAAWLAYTVPASNGWAVVSLQQEAEVLADVRHLRFLALLVTGIVALWTGGLTWLVARRTVRPIVAMTQKAMAIAAGDWQQRMAESRHDELGTLAQAFNQMVSQVEQATRAREEKVAQLSAALADRQAAEAQVTKLYWAVQQSPASVVVTDLHGRIEYVNAKFTEVTGYSPAEAIGQYPRILKSGVHGSELFQAMWAALAAGREWRGELCNRKKDGSLFWERTRISPIRNTQGEIANFMAVKEDITAEKQQTAVLQAINQIFELTLACESDEEVARVCLTTAQELTGSRFGLIGEMNEAGHFDTTALSDASWQACQIPRDEASRLVAHRAIQGMLGRSLVSGESFLCNDVPAYADSQGVPAGHVPLTCFLSVPLRRGKETFGMLALANKAGGYGPGDQEAVEALSAALAESLVRKRAESELRRSESRLSEAMQRARMGSWEWSLTTDEVVASEYVYRIFDLAPTPAATPFSVFWQRIHPDDQTAVQRAIDVAVHDPAHAEFSVDYRVRRPDGHARYVYQQGTVVRAPDGSPLTFVGTLMDITDRKQVEEALRKKEEEFRQAQKLEAVGSLAGGVAHEFNNLLQAIRAFTSFAMKGMQPEEQPYQDLQEVLKASERAANLTRQLLSFSRRQELEPLETHPNEILRDLERMLGPLIGENIDLEMDLDQSVGRLHVDPTMLQQAVMNLCINARDAMPAGGKLLVKTENVLLTEQDCARHADLAPGRFVRLTVSDTGTGIPPGVLKRIFEPFFTTKEIGKGTGLGLAMVYGVVQQHNGSIHVRSQPGEGTTFELYFPATEAEATVVAAPVANAVGGTETILVAEDEPLVRAALVRTLSEAGYRVLAVADGQEAVDLFAQNPAAIALVMLDMIMPRCSGREAQQQIAQISPGTPVVFCTGYDSSLPDVDSAETGGLRLVRKPVDPVVLLATLRDVLDEKVNAPAEEVAG